jgi:hypothetical protein
LRLKALLWGITAAAAVVVLLILIFIPDPWVPVWSFRYHYLIHDGMTVEEVKAVLGPEDRRFRQGDPVPEEDRGRRQPGWAHTPLGRFLEGDEVLLWEKYYDLVRIWVSFKNGRAVEKHYHHSL